MPILKPEHSLSEIRQVVISELAKGAVKKKYPFGNVVLSTLEGEFARSRWVVFRHFTDAGNFLIYTDLRSDKIRQIESNPNCTLLYYHNRQGLQVRVNGKAKIHNQNELTAKYWPGVKGNSAKNYTTEKAPGTPISSISEGEEWNEALNDKYFSILEIAPTEMDVLQLGREGHIRARFIKEDGDWKEDFLVP